MTDEETCRSRTAWRAPTVVVPERRSRLRRLDRLLLVAVVALLLAVATLTFFVYQQQQYVEGRGEYRDRESARLKAELTEAIRQGQCDLLDTFPEGLPSLERAREKYDCGPGIPLSLLTPEEQARIQPPAASPDRPDPLDEADRSRERQPVAPPAPADGASPGGPAPTQEPAPPRPEPAPVDLAPATELLCTVPLLCD